MPRPLLLFLDGQTLKVPGLEETLARGGWDVEMLPSNTVASRTSNREISILLLDPKLSGPAGFQAVQNLRNITADLPVVLLQASSEAQTTRTIAGVAGQIERSLPLHQWVSLLNSVLASIRAERHKFSAEDLFADIIADLGRDFNTPVAHPPAKSAPLPAPPSPALPTPAPSQPITPATAQTDNALDNFVAPWELPASQAIIDDPFAGLLTDTPQGKKEFTLSGIEGVRDPFSSHAPAAGDASFALPAQPSHSSPHPVPEAPAVQPPTPLAKLPQLPVTLPSSIAPTPPDIQISSSHEMSLGELKSEEYRFADSSIPGITGADKGGRKIASKPRQNEPNAGEYMEEFGNYYLLEKIAVGGMAELFKARQRGVHNFEKIVAIKRILPHLSDNDEFVRMFIDEAKLAAQLTHPNIVQIFDLGKAAGSYYIAMEYVDGKDLRSLLRKVREFQIPFPEAVAAAVTMKIAGALDYAHRKKGMNDKELKLVHRDVSPQNVLISGEGAVKLVDFGIAKAATKSTQTIAGALKGKLLYMSPEQALGEPLDCRSDIYSLGLVLFELLTGVRCFQADSELGVLEKVRLGKAQDVQIVNPKVTREMASIVNRALQKDVDRRYPSARLMERDLKTLLSRDGAEPVEHDVAEFANVILNGTKEQVEILISSHFPPRPSSLTDSRSFFPLDEEPEQAATVTPAGSPPSWTTLPTADSGGIGSKKHRILPVIAIVLATLAIALWMFNRFK